MDFGGFALGSAAVKGILRLWTGDTIFNGIEDGPIDEISRRLFTSREQRASDRQMEALADEIAERLEPFLSNEIRGLDEGERNAAVLAAQNSLDSVGALDPKVVVTVDISADALAHLIRQNDPHAITRSLLSNAGAGLYDTLINECAGYIVSIVHRLPGFSIAQATEILGRTSQMIEITKQVLDGLPSSSVPNSWGQGSENQRFENRYRRAVADFSDHLHLYGVTSVLAKVPYQLSVAYISLAVDTGSSKGPARKLNSEDASEEWPIGPESPDPDDSMRIEALLEGSDHVILTGGAGSGKTTLIQWLALSAVSEKRAAESPNPWANRIPFIIPLRRFVSAEFPLPENFISTISSNLSGAMPTGWVHHILAEGRGMLLIDGLDEIPRERRDEAQRWVQTLMRDFPLNKVIVTSRTAAVTRGWLSSTAFRTAALQPMDFSDIRSFVKHWHNAASANAGKSREKDVLAAGKSFLNIVRDTPAIRSLCTSPLLCALICALHLDAGANLPNNRMDVYKTALEMLVIRRDSDRNVYRLQEQEMGYREREFLLRSFALWMHDNGASDSTREDYNDRIKRNIKDLHKVEEKSSTVGSYLLERSGVLREPIPGRVDFVHRTFQEYLAAAAIMEDNSVDRLVLLAHEDHWREVIVMAAGHANSKQRVQLLNGLLDRGEKEATHRPRLFMLAVACMETSPAIDAKLVRRLQQALSSVLPPTNMTDAAAVASAGTLAVNLLRFSGQSATIAAACVRALSLIGGESALDALATYGSDRRVTVTRQLIRAWSGFDTEKYARKVLAKSPLDKGRVIIKEAEQLASLKHLENAQHVYVDLPGALSDPMLIPDDNPTIYGLDASVTPWLKSVQDFPSMPGLQSLSLRGNPLVDLDGIERYPMLRYLALNQCHDLHDIAALSNLDSLDYLDLSGTVVQSLDVFTDNQKLRSLRLSGASELKSICRPVPARFLYLPFAPKLEDASGLAVSEHLESLTLGVISSKLDKITLPSSLKSLRFLFELAAELPSISGAKNLTSLTMDGTLGETAFDWIASLSSLRSVRWATFGNHIYSSSLDESIERFFDIPQINELEVWMQDDPPEFPYLNLSILHGWARYSRVIQ